MEVYVKESLYVLDYQDKKTDVIFISDDRITPGYAYGINIKESNTGYSDLSFEMPNTIITNEGDKIKNPKLSLLTPLVKLRYEREVYYTGEKSIQVKEPSGYGDTIVYTNVTYNPGDKIEDYIMDYIVQPIDKKRNGLEISTSFTAIDYPRFNLSKKKYGIAIDDNTTVRSDWSMSTKEPVSVAGEVEYIKWDSQYAPYAEVPGEHAIPLEWNPTDNSGYPLSKKQVEALMNSRQNADKVIFPYGLTSTIFYWPITETGRYEGVLYTKGDYLTLNIFSKKITDSVTQEDMEGYYTEGKDYIYTKYTYHAKDDWVTTMDISMREIEIYRESGTITDPNYLGKFEDLDTLKDAATRYGQWAILKQDVHSDVGGYEHTWTYLEQGRPLLTPNNPCNYLLYDLQITNWTIKHSFDRYKGTFTDVNGFPTNVNDEDYVILKTIFKNSNYKGSKEGTSSLPMQGNSYGDWYFITETKDGKIVDSHVYQWDGSSWNINWEDKYLVGTKFYAYRDNEWIDVTEEGWAYSIDKKTGALYDVDQVTKDVFKPDDAEGGIYDTAVWTAKLNFSDSNAYNIITEIAKAFQLYPVFDCINRTVSLKVFAGKNYGLTYSLGNNIDSDTVKLDGEKVITKLRCYGGTGGSEGTEKINIGKANRAYTVYLNGMYTDTQYLPTNSVEGYWAIVDPDLNEEYWKVGANRQLYYYVNTENKWYLGTNKGDNIWIAKVEDIAVEVDIQTGMMAPWTPNDPAYIQARSPYGTEYIYNFKWMYDNGWMTKEQILSLYSKSLEIQELNKSFLPDYEENYERALDLYTAAKVKYETNQDERLACINSMSSTYSLDSSYPSKGTAIAFPYAPKGATLNSTTQKYEVNFWYCDSCAEYRSFSEFTTCPTCGSTQIKNRPMVINTYDDTDLGIVKSKTSRLKPKYKGFYQQCYNVLGATYYTNLSITTPFKYDTPENDDEGQFNIHVEGTDSGYKKRDSSGVLMNWSDYVEQWPVYYLNEIFYEKELDKRQRELEKLDEAYKVYKSKADALEDYIQDNWGDYIVEGKFSDEQIQYVPELLIRSLEASEEYSIPQVTYNLNVIDTSGLIEYREHTDDTYNDVVHMLHNVGQIVPHAGDYCVVYDEPMGLFGVSALITEIGRILDDPMSNHITLDTSYTDDKELVGNIISATNTVLNNSDIYARTAVIKADGTLDKTAFNDTLTKMTSSDITISGVDGTSVLNSMGLTVTDPANANYKIRYGGGGIYTTLDNGVIWQPMITQNGINANYINAGTIDTRTVQITSGKQAKIVLDNRGLTIKNDETQEVKIPNTCPSNISEWTNSNISSFMGVDSNNNAMIYTKGQIYAESGSNIAGWITDSNSFYHLTGTTKDLWLSPNGISGTVYNNTKDMLIYAKGKFGVDANGIMYANGAKISGSGEFTGKIVINTDDSSMTKGSITGGSIGGMTITSDTLSTYYKDDKNNWINGTGLSSNASKYAFWAGESNHVNGTASSNAKFTVSHDGTIEAKAGHIGGWTIEADKLSGSGKISGGTISGSTISGGTITIEDNFKVTSDGKITAKSASLTGTLYTGDKDNGWIINDDYIKNRGSGGDGGRANLFADGRISLYPKMSDNTGGTFLVNNGARMSMSKGIALSSSADGSVKAADGNLDLKACTNHTAYMASMSRADGTGETSAVQCSLNTAEIRGKTEAKITSGDNCIIVQDDEIAIHPEKNDRGLQIYGSYNNETKYHTGRSGKFEVAYDSILGVKTAYLCFVNGIFVGMET